MWYITKTVRVESLQTFKLLDCPPTHKLWCLETDNLNTDRCPLSDSFYTDKDKSSTYKYRRETCCVANSVRPHSSSGDISFYGRTDGRTDRPTALYFLITCKLQQYIKKTSAWFKIHTCATDLVNFSPNETLCFCLVHMSLLFFSLFLSLHSCPYV